MIRGIHAVGPGSKWSPADKTLASMTASLRGSIMSLGDDSSFITDNEFIGMSRGNPDEGPGSKWSPIDEKLPSLTASLRGSTMSWDDDSSLFHDNELKGMSRGNPEPMKYYPLRLWLCFPFCSGLKNLSQWIIFFSRYRGCHFFFICFSLFFKAFRRPLR